MSKESNPEPGPNQIKPSAPPGPPKVERASACGYCFLACMKSESGCFKKDFDQIQTENARLKGLLDKVQNFLSKGHNDALFEEIEQVLKGESKEYSIQEWLRDMQNNICSVLDEGMKIEVVAKESEPEEPIPPPVEEYSEADVSKNKQSKLPRFIHHLWANLRGYYWLPCPICGRKYGGHETNAVLWNGPNSGSMICRDPSCLKEAQRRNEFYATQDPAASERGKSKM